MFIIQGMVVAVIPLILSPFFSHGPATTKYALNARQELKRVASRQELAELVKEVEESQKTADDCDNSRSVGLFGIGYGVWGCGLTFGCLYFIRFSVESWLGSLFNHHILDKQLMPLNTSTDSMFDPLVREQMAAQRTALFLFYWQLGGFGGALLAGPLSDRLFQGRRMPLASALSLILVFAIPSLQVIESDLSIRAAGFFIGIGVYGHRPLYKLFTRDQVTDPTKVGPAVAASNLLAEFGATLGGYPLIRIVDRFSWNVYVPLLQGMAVALLLGNLILFKACERKTMVNKSKRV